MTKKRAPEDLGTARELTGHALFRRRQRHEERQERILQKAYANRQPDTAKPLPEPPLVRGGAGTYDEDIIRRFAQGHTVAQVAKEYSVTRQYLWSHFAPEIRAMIRVRTMPDRAILVAPAAPLGRPRAARQGKVGPTPQ